MKKKTANLPVKKSAITQFGAILSDKNLVRGDGWGNILTGLGTGNDKKMSAFLQYDRLNEVDVETLYAQDDMASKIIDLLPDHGMRKWIDFQGLDEKQELNLQEKLQYLKLKQQVLQHLKWGRLYGGAGLLIGTDEMQDLTNPYVPQQVNDILSFTLMTRYELYPSQLQYNPLRQNFGYPEYYRLQLRGTTPINGSEVHHTRIIRAEGVELPRRLHIQNQYWGDSVLSRIWQIIRNFSTTHDAVATVMQDFRIGIFKMKNLADMVAMGQDGVIQRRLALVDAAKSVARSVVIDADNEDFEQATGQLSGIKDLIDAVNDRFVAATGMPITVLLGKSPQGLGGSGRHEETNWYDMVAAYQEDHIRPILKKAVESVLLSKNGPTGGQIPEGFGFTFNPLWQLDEAEQATMRYTQAQADAIYMENGAVSPEEIALSRFGQEKWDAHTKIDLDIRKKLNSQGTQIENPQANPQDQNAQQAGQETAQAQTVAPGDQGKNLNPQKGILDPGIHIPAVELTSSNQIDPDSGAIATVTANDPRDDGEPLNSPTDPRAFSPSGDLQNLNNDLLESTGKASNKLNKEAELKITQKSQKQIPSDPVMYDAADTSKPAQVIVVSKEVAKSKSEAKKLASQASRGQEFNSLEETSTAYRFKMRDPQDFQPGTVSSVKVPEIKGVTVIFGKLK